MTCMRQTNAHHGLGEDCMVTQGKKGSWACKKSSADGKAGDGEAGSRRENSRTPTRCEARPHLVRWGHRNEETLGNYVPSP